MNSFFHLWGWPIALGALTATGLATALLSDHWGDVWSWLGLGVPVAVMARYSFPRRSPAHPPPQPTNTSPGTR